MMEYILQEILGWTLSFFLQESHTEGLLLLIHVVNTGHTDPKERFVSIKVTPSNDRVLYVYVLSGYNTSKLLARGCFFKGLQNYIEN